MIGERLSDLETNKTCSYTTGKIEFAVRTGLCRVLRSAEHGNVLLCRASFLQTHGTESVLGKTHADTRQSKSMEPTSNQRRAPFRGFAQNDIPVCQLDGAHGNALFAVWISLVHTAKSYSLFFSISFFPCFLSFFILLLMLVCHKIFLLIY